jgi:4-amino-4-deoxy-L-arabinose transferase-like glycosyltransferase
MRRPTSAQLAGVVMVLALAAVLRIVDLGHGLPGLVAPDEPVVLLRAQQLAHHTLPTEYDWPTGAMVVLAGWLEVIRQGTATAPYLSGRVLFAAISLGLVVLTGVLAASIVEARLRWLSAGVAMAAMAVAYPAVRVGRTLHPDPLQSALVVVSLLAAVAYVRAPAWRWAILAGVAAGLAAGTKYIGGFAVVSVAAAVLGARALPRSTRAKHLAGAAAAAVAGFVAAVPATVVHPGKVLDGLSLQLDHQSGGHLGYDGSGPSFWFHLTTALPGTWGWGFTAVCVAGACFLLVRGTPAQRLVAIYVVVAFLVVGWGVVQFPHYVLVYLAPLAALGAVAVVTGVDRLHLPHPAALAWWAAAGLLAFAPTVLNDVRLLRAQRAPDTEQMAAAVAATLDGRIIKEQYTDTSSLGTRIDYWGHHPALLSCGCVAEVSSYVEDRYRREPTRFADEVAVYDAIRARGTVLATVAPSRRLSYRWDGLPQWGIRSVPLRGPVGVVGPTITFFALPAP